MKKTYYATCVSGLERAVEAQLRRETGVIPEWSAEGAVLFRAEKEPNFLYLHNVFLVLHTMRGLPDLNAAVKKLLLAGDWLDRMPYDRVGQPGKRFRIVTSVASMRGGRLEPVDMRYLSLLERVICEHTGMRVCRERPDVELWLTRCGGHATVFAWRLSAARAGKASGAEMRADLCGFMAVLAKAGGGSAVCLGGGEPLARALRASGCASVSERADAAACGGVADASADAVVGWLCREWRGGAEARATLLEARRMLAANGRAVLLAPEGAPGIPLEAAPDQAAGLDTLDCYALRVGGRVRRLWVLAPPMPAEAR